MFSSTSLAGWTTVGLSAGRANTVYVGFERVRKLTGYIYFWTLGEYLKPIKQGPLRGGRIPSWFR